MQTAYDLHEMHNRIFVFVNFFSQLRLTHADMLCAPRRHLMMALE